MKTKDRNYVRESSWILLIGLIALALGACAIAQSDAGEPQSQPQTSPSKTPLATLNPILPTQGDNSQMTPFPPTPSGLEGLIEKAKEDLAQRLSIPTSDITLVDAKAVTWPDSSIGCPQPDMICMLKC